MVINWRDEQRNREARTGVSTSRKSQMMEPDNCNHPSTITVADCWVEERNDAGMNCYECEKCGILLEKHPSCDVHYDSQDKMKTIITMRVVFDKEEEADTLLEALTDLDNDGLFPTGADIRTEYDYQWASDSDKYIDVEETANA